MLALLAGCGDDAVQAPDAPAPDAAIPIDASGDAIASGLYPLDVDAGAFPPVGSHPNVIVYVPANFDPTPPLSIVVFLHGFDNCIENIVQASGGECTPDGGTRAAYGLIDQMEAANKNALLICPELAFDQSTGNPGQLGNPNGFRALLTETLADLGMRIGDVGPVVVASHSGGYQAASAIVSRGGVPVVELYLLDSLYGDTSTFDAWAMSNIAADRFADVYTQGGGTLANSQAMADRAATWVNPDAGLLVDDRTTATWPDSTYHHPLLFKLSGLSHDGVPAYYFGHLVGTSQIPQRGAR